MQSCLSSSKLGLILCLIMPAVPALAADVAVDCAKKSLTNEIGKLNKLATNKIQISGTCTENIVIDGHLNLTLAGNPGASISAASPAANTLDVNNSSVTVQALTLNGGSTGAFCSNRSTCIFRDVIVQGGDNGIGAQGQSAIDVIGASSIQNSLGTGIGVYGASSVNMRPTWANGFDPVELGPVISGHPTGANVQDGSFLRADSVTISGNGAGVFAQRNATIKIFGNGSGASISDNSDFGVFINRASVAQLIIDFSNNGNGTDGAGAVAVGALSYVAVQGGVFSSNKADSLCWGGATGVLQFGPDFSKSCN